MAADSLFRFEDLEVWQKASDLGFELGEIADVLEQKRRYRYAEQLRSAGLSISNNIAEGSGSTSNNEFRYFLNIARRSSFECASMLVMFERQRLTAPNQARPMLERISSVCRMITSLSRSLD